MNTTTTAPPRNTVLQILKMHLTGDDPTVIALASGVEDPQVVTDTAELHGWPDKQKVRAAVRRLENAAPTARPGPTPRAALPSARPTPSAPPKSPAQAVADLTVEQLLEDAKETGVEALRTRAARTEREVQSLRDAYSGYLTVRDRHKEVERLEKELAKARAAAGVADKKADQLVRVWAKRQGIDVGDRGRLPQAVRDRYVAAHAKTGASR